MLQQVTIIFHWAGGRALRFSYFAGSFSDNVRPIAFSVAPTDQPSKSTALNKLPLQSLPIVHPSSSILPSVQVIV